VILSSGVVRVKNINLFNNSYEVLLVKSGDVLGLDIIFTRQLISVFVAIGYAKIPQYV